MAKQNQQQSGKILGPTTAAAFNPKRLLVLLHCSAIAFLFCLLLLCCQNEEEILGLIIVKAI